MNFKINALVFLLAILVIQSAYGFVLQLNTYNLTDGDIYFNQTFVCDDDGSFKTLFPSKRFGANARQVFFESSVLSQADRQSFKVYNNYLASDKNYIYKADNRNQSRLEVVPNDEFKPLSRRYYADKKGIYFLDIVAPFNGNQTRVELKRIEGVKDPSKFALIFDDGRKLRDPCLQLAAVDDEAILLFDQKINVCKGSQLEFISFPQDIMGAGAYLSNQQEAFYFYDRKWRKLETEAVDQLTFVNRAFVTDGTRLYHRGKAVKENDSEKFIDMKKARLVRGNWLIYNQQLYYLGGCNFKYVGPVDQTSFEVLRNYAKRGIGAIHIARDNDSYFYRDHQYKRKPLHENIRYALEKYPNLLDAVYVGGELVNGADPLTHIPLKNYYSIDKNTVFYLNSTIKIADRDTFRVLDHGYALDAKQVYYKGIPIPEADPNTFSFAPGRFHVDAPGQKVLYHDSTNRYHNGKIVNEIGSLR
ncbi:MAG: DKNYY domain-containing protein [Candidatus Rifleibacteriota bacterium]